MKEKKLSREEKLKARARKRSIKEGIFASMMFSFGNNYLSPFAIAINASNSIVALFGSVSGILGPLSQLFGSKLIEKHSRKSIVRKAVLIESLIWIPIILIAVLFSKGIIVSFLPLLLLLVFGFFVIAGNTAGPAWFSWMGDITEDNSRGRFFSKRNMITGFVSLVLAISASVFLDYFRDNGKEMIGFGILFALAGLARLYSWHCFKYQYEPKIKLKKGYSFGFFEFVLQAPKNNFGKFAIYRASLSLANAISAPLLAVYLLRTLGFSYTTYMILIMAGSVFSIIFVEVWGKFSDEYGNYRTIALTSILVPLIPLLWVVNPHPLYLLIVPSLIGGLAWSGFNLAAGNFIYDNVSHDKRGLAVSYYNMLGGIGTFIGAGIGAILIKVIATSLLAPVIIVFLIGSLARMIVVFFALPHIKEVKKTKEITGAKAFKRMFLRELKPTIKEEIHQIMEIKSYIRS